MKGFSRKVSSCVKYTVINIFFFLGSGIVRCDIPGLVSRVEKPLDFLGLYKTEHEASLRAHIPAREISGKTPYITIYLFLARSSLRNRIQCIGT